MVHLNCLYDPPLSPHLHTFKSHSLLSYFLDKYCNPLAIAESSHDWPHDPSHKFLPDTSIDFTHSNSMALYWNYQFNEPIWNLRPLVFHDYNFLACYFPVVVILFMFKWLFIKFLLSLLFTHTLPFPYSQTGSTSLWHKHFCSSSRRSMSPLLSSNHRDTAAVTSFVCAEERELSYALC